MLWLTCFLLIISMAVASNTFENNINADLYGSVRIGLDYVDTGTLDDSVNKRDFLSRIGVKARTRIRNDFSGVLVIEYGLQAVKLDDIEVDNLFFRRLTYVGIKGAWGELNYGTQNLVFHTFLRNSFFSDSNDSIRQGTIRDDDLLQYFYSTNNWSLGLGTQFSEREANYADQFQIAGEYSFIQSKYQLGMIKDNQGENTGKLIGARIWWYPGKEWTMSLYHQVANESFDLYSGSTTGNLQSRHDVVARNIVGVRSCPSEDRSSSGIYVKYNTGKHTFHGRKAKDMCDRLGGVDSVKLEYILQVLTGVRTWFSVELLNNDQSRAPLSSSGDSLSEIQFGIRYDF